MRISRSSLFLLVAIVCILVYINFQNDRELTFDAARHACDGHFFYDYFRTILGGRFVSLPQFLADYSQKGYNIGWYVLYDPPVFGISQAIVFLFLGDSKFNVKFTNQLMLVVAMVFVYLIACRIFKKKSLALASAIIYGLLPFNYNYARNGYDPLSVVAFTLGWYYFFFIKEPKNVKIRITKYHVFALNLNILVAGLFFTAASLVKYHMLVYVVAFAVLYGMYLLTKQYRQRHSFSLRPLFVDSGFSQLFKNMVIIGVIFLLIGGWWLKFSLLDNQMYTKMTWMVSNKEENFGYPDDWPYRQLLFGLANKIFFTPLAVLYWTGFLLPLAFLPLLFKAKREWYSENIRMIFFILAVYVANNFLMTDHKFRYSSNMFPFVFLFIMAGVVALNDFFTTRFNTKFSLIIIVILAIIPLVFSHAKIRNIELDTYAFGRENHELIDYFKQKPDPKLLINVKGYDIKLVKYAHSPDLFIFSAMLINKEHDPVRMQQYVQYLEWIALEPQYKQLAAEMNRTSYQIPTYIAMFKYEPDHKIEKLGTELEKVYEFKVTNFTYYYVYEKLK
jgi:hypothetical protein